MTILAITTNIHPPTNPSPNKSIRICWQCPATHCTFTFKVSGVVSFLLVCVSFVIEPVATDALTSSQCYLGRRSIVVGDDIHVNEIAHVCAKISSHVQRDTRLSMPKSGCTWVQRSLSSEKVSVRVLIWEVPKRCEKWASSVGSRAAKWKLKALLKIILWCWDGSETVELGFNMAQVGYPKTGGQ